MFTEKETLEEDLSYIEISLQLATGEERYTLYKMKKIILDSIKKLDEKTGRNGNQREFIEEDNGDGY